MLLSRNTPQVLIATSTLRCGTLTTQIDQVIIPHGVCTIELWYTSRRKFSERPASRDALTWLLPHGSRAVGSPRRWLFMSQSCLLTGQGAGACSGIHQNKHVVCSIRVGMYRQKTAKAWVSLQSCLTALIFRFLKGKPGKHRFRALFSVCSPNLETNSPEPLHTK